MHPTFPAGGDGGADDQFDVLIVGAGLSGIGAAWHLQRGCPGKRYAILEARSAIGGTWDLFRYPGVRSDSDMYTLGYGFQPWTAGKAIADGAAIRGYIDDTARRHGIAPHIRFDHTVRAAAWSSVDALWTVEVEHGGRRHALRTRFLYLCSGYYDYAAAHRPEFMGEGCFRGRIVQPQFWPRDLDWSGKRVVVVGSGATAVTLVPALARTAAHVTMLQRSPTHIVSRPSEYGFAQTLRRWLPPSAAHALTRWRVIAESMLLYRVVRARPELAQQKIVAMARRQLGPGIDVATHFTPRHKPWDQRICIAPDGDLFEAIRSGRASVATDHIERFEADGLVLRSGRKLDADVVVMATGLTIRLLGGIAVSVDGKAFDPGRAMSYKGMLLSGLPNCIMTFGYTNASWTLKADLTAAYACRLLRHMDRTGADIALVRRDPTVTPAPFLDFSSGYVQRAQGILPQQGTRRPWMVYQDYLRDMLTIRYGRVADGVMRFGAKGQLP
jgi:cyclohexanone monooxygenase